MFYVAIWISQRNLYGKRTGGLGYGKISIGPVNVGGRSMQYSSPARVYLAFNSLGAGKDSWSDPEEGELGPVRFLNLKLK